MIYYILYIIYYILYIIYYILYIIYYISYIIYYILLYNIGAHEAVDRELGFFYI